jgi:ribosomal protein S27AE
MKLRMRAVQLAVRVRPKPAMTCARCGDALYMARGAEYVDPQRIRHQWSCDECGYSFETLASSARLQPLPLAI